MKKSTRNILIGAGAGAAALAAIGGVSYAITKRMVGLAMDRNAPEIVNRTKDKLIGAEEFADFYKEVAEAAVKLENSGLEEVEITAQDGVRLAGHWYECPNAKRVVVAMHGWRSSWSNDFGTIADFLHSNGCSVLYAEQRGQGRSGGDYIGFGMLERYDCRDWANWVSERTCGELPIYLAGLSMGATTVLMAAGLDLPDNVRGIVADCGFTSPHAIWKHVVETNFHMPYDIRSSIASDICKKNIQMGAKDYSSVDAMKECEIPVLFIHGTSDKFVPVDMTYENYIACSAPKKLFIVPGAEHGMSYHTDRDGYEKAVRELWRERE